MTTIAIVDTETTGLDPERHEVWEVALILLNVPTTQKGAEVVERDGAGRELHRHHEPDIDLGLRTIEHVWQLPVDLARAEPAALSIGKFYERRYPHCDGANDRIDLDSRYRIALEGPSTEGLGYVVPPHLLGQWAHEFAALTSGLPILGFVPSFDERRLDKLLRAHGAAPAWHYRPICVETLAVGYQIGRWAQARLDATEIEEEPDGSLTRYRKPGRTVEPGPFRLELPWKSDHVSKALGIEPPTDRHSAIADCRWVVDVLNHLLGGP